MRLSPAEISTLLKQNPENIRLWSIEFARHLSKTAAPDGRGKHRVYNEDDLSVLALVADYKSRDIAFDVIHKVLDDGERLMPGIAPSGLTLYQEKLAAAEQKVRETELSLVQETQRATIAEGQVQLLEKQLAGAQERVEKLLVEIALLKAMKSNE